jgi:hypothetical protein
LRTPQRAKRSPEDIPAGNNLFTRMADKARVDRFGARKHLAFGARDSAGIAN